jgi:hypothetical protein
MFNYLMFFHYQSIVPLSQLDNQDRVILPLLHRSIADLFDPRLFLSSFLYLAQLAFRYMLDCEILNCAKPSSIVSIKKKHPNLFFIEKSNI